MAFVLGLKGKHPVRSSVVLVVMGLGIVAFMPDTWTQRMDTIANYREDASAMQRIWAWTTLWNVAVDRPLIGAGFRADNAVVFGRYGNIPEFEAFFGRYTPVAHSSYFQALGEHGFVGLALYVVLGVWIWFAAGALARRTAEDPEYAPWLPLLLRMCQVSVIGFAVGGAFLSLMLLDIPYYILAFVVLAQATVNERAARTATQPTPTALQGGPPNVDTRRTTS
jgi:probable O-glycosylation ligase (exosortase A-associated)